MAGTAVISTIKHDVSGAAPTFRDGAGNEIGQLTKAWVNLGGGSATTSGYAYGSFNVSSITTNGTGDYTVNFSRSMADAYYAVQVTGNFFTSTSTASVGTLAGQTGYFQTGSIRVGHNQYNAYCTFTYMSVTVHR